MILDRFKLDEKVAIVTGAGRGIGRGTALALAEAGADIVCAARTLEQIEETAGMVRERGRKAVAVTCDVNEEEQLAAVVDRAVSELGRIDVVVNNAGGTPVRPARRARISAACCGATRQRSHSIQSRSEPEAR